MAKAKNGEAAVNSSSSSVFTLLRHISATQRPLGVAELHRITGEPISSTHRALMTLEEAGLVARFGPTAKFGPGQMAHHMIRALISRFPARRRGLPLLKEIIEATNSAATLHVRLGWFSLRVGWAEGRHEFFQQRRIGETRLLHTGAAPLCMLASFPDEMFRRYVSDIGRRYPEESTALRSKALTDALAAARDQGYAVGRDPLRDERSWVATPILAADGTAAASISFALRDADLPSGGRKPELFLRVTALIGEFQALVAREPGEIAHPYDHLDPSDINIDLPHSVEK